MHKRLLVVVAALLALALMLSACGGGSSSSTKIEPKEPKLYNVNAYWIHEGNTAPYAETLAFPNDYATISSISHATQSADFTVYPQGVTLKLGRSAELLRARLLYSTNTHPAEQRYFPWNGKRIVPMTKTIRTYSGKKQQFQLRKVEAYVYDPRYDKG